MRDPWEGNARRRRAPLVTAALPRFPIARSPPAVISALWAGVGSRIRAHDHALTVARTIAGLADAGAIGVEHLAKALAYRGLAGRLV